MSTTPVRVGVIGCGNISTAYLRAGATFDILDIVACADLVIERAQARAAEFAIPRACSVDELLADPDIEMVINLTIPQAHAELALRALAAGKSVYNEKPLAVGRDEGRQLVEQARASGLLLGGAPDTFLGAGLQTCRALLDAGAIGTPVAATAFMLNHGHESWHPDPAFYYKAGGGPMFDMGPYYLTALVSLLGPVRRAAGSARISQPERTITSLPKRGETITVEVPTHIAGVLDFTAGPVATIVTSFDVWANNVPKLEIYGTAGTLSLPDPNTFGGPVRLYRADEGSWEEIPLERPYASNSRSIGAADMAYALRLGRPHRANGDLAFHVLDIMHAIHEASDTGQAAAIQSSCERPAPLPAALREGQLDS